MKYIDLFAGIGGFRCGLESIDREENGRSKTTKANGNSKGYKKLKGIVSKRGRQGKHSNTRRLKELFTCVYSNEWDKYAAQVYKKHYEEIDTTDITKVNTKDIPDHDLLCAGFPCQSFSIAGKRKGFKDTRGTLFFDIARILSEKRPRLVLLENVKGLLSHDQGKTFQTILGVLSDLGYRVEWQVLNSKHFGVPQNRERVFIVGHLGGFGGRKIFPLGSTDKLNNDKKQKLPEQISNTLRTNYSGGYSNETYILGRKESYAIDSSYGKGTNTLDKGRRQMVLQGKIRRLTPTECERLQGFPDGWTEGLSDTQRYKCLGNAVTTKVVEAIGKALVAQ